MQKVLLSVATAAALSFASLAAQASQDTSEGTFIGINGGGTHYDITHGSFNDKTDTAFGGVVGYRWAVDRPFYFGVEGGYVDLGKITSRYGDSETFTSFDGSNHTAAYTENHNLKGGAVLVGANGKWELPHHWTITARFGLAHSRTTYDVKYNATLDGASVDNEKFHSSSTDNGIYAGVGFGYDFTRNFSITLNYDTYALKSYIRAVGQEDSYKRSVNVGVWGGAAEFRF